MRQLTIAERVTLWRFGKCPLCHHELFHFGPKGGAGINIYCAHCGAGFNCVDPDRVANYGEGAKKKIVSMPAQQIGEPRPLEPLRRWLGELSLDYLKTRRF